MRKELKEAITMSCLGGFGSGIASSMILYAIWGEFPWTYLITFSSLFSIMWYYLRKKIKKYPRER